MANVAKDWRMGYYPMERVRPRNAKEAIKVIKEFKHKREARLIEDYIEELENKLLDSYGHRLGAE